MLGSLIGTQHISHQGRHKQPAASPAPVLLLLVPARRLMQASVVECGAEVCTQLLLGCKDLSQRPSMRGLQPAPRCWVQGTLASRWQLLLYTLTVVRHYSVTMLLNYTAIRSDQQEKEETALSCSFAPMLEAS